MATLKKPAVAKKAAPKKAAPVKKAAPQKVVSKTVTPREPAQRAPSVVMLDFTPESKELLQAFLSACTTLGAAATIAVAQAPKVTAQTVTPPPAAPVEQSAPVTATPAATTAPVEQTTPAATETAVDLTAIRNEINSKAGLGKTAAVIALLGKFGASSASTLTPENYAAFFNELKTL